MADQASAVSDEVLKCIKSSGLDFKVIETPFSLEIMIKKKFIKYNSGSSSQLHSTFSKSLDDACPKPSHFLPQPQSTHNNFPNSMKDLTTKPMIIQTLTTSNSNSMPLKFSSQRMKPLFNCEPLPAYTSSRTWAPPSCPVHTLCHPSPACHLPTP